MRAGMAGNAAAAGTGCGAWRPVTCHGQGPPADGLQGVWMRGRDEARVATATVAAGGAAGAWRWTGRGEHSVPRIVLAPCIGATRHTTACGHMPHLIRCTTMITSATSTSTSTARWSRACRPPGERLDMRGHAACACLAWVPHQAVARHWCHSHSQPCPMRIS